MSKVQLQNHAMNVEIIPGVLPMDTVFLHGNLASNVWWEPAAEIWKKNAKPSYEGRMIMAEWRGCGGSDAAATEDDMRMDLLGKDYVDMLRQIGVKKANLVAHSTGGLIGLYAMMQAPELFDYAFLLDSVSATGIQFPAEMYAAFTQMSQDRDFCATIMGATIHNNDATKPFFQKIVDAAFSVKKTVWHGVPKNLNDVNILEDIKNIKNPILVCHGEHDLLLPKEGSMTLASNLPNGKFFEVKGHGHCTNYEDPELFVKLVNEFLFERK
jgi:pimeloyl-ACP methyl ester carboxylesterase